MKKISRNAPCLCGSGKKFKQCCYVQAEAQPVTEHSAAMPIPEALQVAMEHHRAGRLPSAKAIYQQILQIEPNHPDALHLLGAVAHQEGKEEIAFELISKALKLHPTSPMHYNLGLTLQSQGKLEEAIASYRQALVLKPDYAEVLYSLGLAFQAQGKPLEAIESYRQAIVVRPDYAVAHNNLGLALQAQGKLDEAVVSYRQAVMCKPDYAVAYNNLGTALKEQGKLDLAVENYRHALNLRPDYADAHSNLGNALQGLGQAEAAAESYCKSLSFKPDHVEALNNLGALFKEQGKLDAAVGCYQKALMLNPHFAAAHGNLANAFLAQGRLDAAVESYRAALTLKPNYVEAHSNLLFALSFNPKCAPAQLRAEADCYGRKVLAKAKPYTNWSCLSNETADTDGGPLRVGLVSGDLKKHPVGFFLEGILANLNPARIKLVAYSTKPHEDALTVRIKPFFAAWNSIVGLSDEAAARMIHDDGIHILIDLAGHTAHNRLPLFAWKSAPLQVSWLGYFATTGVPGMDYLLADQMSVPESDHEFFTEKIWYLPGTRLCFTPPPINDKLVPCALPALRNGYITFGCFQSLAKLTDAVFAVWGQIFQALPQARLRVQNKQLNHPAAREQLLKRLINAGIVEERLIIEGPVLHADYLAAHADVDIILDTFPYPGGTTTCEALWMGVPTLTLVGETMLSRQGASLLTAAGLEDWIARDVDDYVARAVAHATDPGRLSKLRAGLRQQVLASPLFDTCRFALNLEHALHSMWRQKKNNLLGQEEERKDTIATGTEGVTIHQLFQAAMEHHQAGRLPEAEAIYRQVLQVAPDQPDALHLLGVIAHQEGKHEVAVELIAKAVRLHPTSAMCHNLGLALQAQGKHEAAIESYSQALSLKPDYADAYGNMGLACHLQGKLEAAVESYRMAISLKPDYAAAHNNLANVLKEQGKLEAAIESYRQALVCQPDYAAAHNNMGNALQDQGKLEAAVNSYQKALCLNPDYADAYSNLGLALMALGKIDAAINVYFKALAIKPDSVEAYNNLGLAFQTQGKFESAIESYQKALAIKPNSVVALNGLAATLFVKGEILKALEVSKRSFQIEERGETKALIARCLQKTTFVQDDAGTRDLLVRALSEPWARPAELVKVCVSLIMLNRSVKQGVERVASAWPLRLSGVELLGRSGLTPLCDDFLFQSLLENAPVSSLELERFLTMMRSVMLDGVMSAGIPCETTPEISKEREDKGLAFYCALARQCFINEYVFTYTDEEFAKVQLLRQKVAGGLASSAPISAWWIAIVGAYLPLSSLPGVEALCAQPWPSAVTALLAQQVQEPLKELRYRTSIPSLTLVEDSVSRLVQQQYEENPYPRWVQTSLSVNSTTIDIFLHQQVPFASFCPYGKVDDLDILIAGCGTGQQSIETARQFRDARVLAVDLSMASLCYAKRKTEELGIKNIEYAQADIMQLESTGRRFDIIESVGVLHHLADPKAGWRVLLSVLRPNGFMRLGFYSELGRQNIVAARSFIAKQGYGSNCSDIRRCRQDLMSTENILQFNSLVLSRDFFGTSECRDLLFHVQEHRLTLPQLKDMMAELGVNFLGFDIDARAIEKYRARFPDDNQMANLDYWHIFETENQNLFAGMYQFWVQKRDK